MQPRILIGVGWAGYPQHAAGVTWAFLNYVLGFQRLGWEVWIVEEIETKKLVWDESETERTPASSVNVRYFNGLCRGFGLEARASLFIDGECPNRDDLIRFSKEAQLFINLSGHFKQHDIFAPIPHRVYADLDPGFTQIWAEVYNCNMNFEGHNQFITVGLGYDQPGVDLPRAGKEWIPSLPPICLEEWDPAFVPPAPNPSTLSPALKGIWTTVTHWHGYAAVEWQGLTFDNKSRTFAEVRDLPRKTKATLGLATDLGPDDENYALFTDAGWVLAPAAPFSYDWKDYRAFIAESRGEFCVAKHGYSTVPTGWFSDRTVSYLALGKPVVLQETGWSRVLPSDFGLLPFTTTDEAAAQLDKVEADYTRHSQAALMIAKEYLEARIVLQTLLKKLGV
jgi:hypothetical protein